MASWETLSSRDSQCTEVEESKNGDAVETSSFTTQVRHASRPNDPKPRTAVGPFKLQPLKRSQKAHCSKCPSDHVATDGKMEILCEYRPHIERYPQRCSNAPPFSSGIDISKSSSSMQSVMKRAVSTPIRQADRPPPLVLLAMSFVVIFLSVLYGTILLSFFQSEWVG